MKTTTLQRKWARPATGVFLVLLALLPALPGITLAGELAGAPGAPRPELRLADLDGRERGLDEFAGKVLLVNFWASWCTPCLQEMPSIRRLAEELRGRPFAVIAVNVAEGLRRAATMARRLELDFPVLLDEDGAVFREWGGTVLPTTYVLDGGGKVRVVGRGPMEWDAVEIVQMLERLMAPAAPVEGSAPRLRRDPALLTATGP